MKRILTTIGAGRLIGVAMTAGIVAGAIIAVPLFASAGEKADGEPATSVRPAAFQRLLDRIDGFDEEPMFGDADAIRTYRLGRGDANEFRMDGNLDESSESGITFSFEASIGDGDPVRLGGNLVELVAELTGTEPDEVEAALEDGQSLTEYAVEHGLSEDELLDTLMSDVDERLAEAVENGDLTQDEADRIRTELNEHLSNILNGEFPGPPGGFPFGSPEEFPFLGGPEGIVGRFAIEFNPLESVAELTGTETEEVIDALQDGQTLAEFAAGHGVSEDDLVNALLEDARTSTEEAVANGDLTHAEADELLTRLEEHARSIVNGEGFGFRHHLGPGPFEGIFIPGECDDPEDGDTEGGESTSNQV